MEEFEHNNICTHWPNNPAFDPKWVLLRRLFFINEEWTKYVSVGFFSHATIHHWSSLGLSGGRGPKTLILRDEQVDALADTLPTLREDMCCGEAGVGGARVVPSGCM